MCLTCLNLPEAVGQSVLVQKQKLYFKTKQFINTRINHVTVSTVKCILEFFLFIFCFGLHSRYLRHFKEVTFKTLLTTQDSVLNKDRCTLIH